jgi:hypothetical protein
MAVPSAEEIIGSIKATLEGIINEDLPVLTDFAQRQLKALADQTVWIAEATANGEFNSNPGLRDHFLTTLADMTNNFAKVMAGLILLTIEKIWNSLVSLLWDTLDKATGLTLPRPAPG